VWIKYLVINTYNYFSSCNEQINGKYIAKKHREIGEHKKKEISDSFGPCSYILNGNHSSYNYSVCHKLLNMQNICTLPSMVIWKLLIIFIMSPVWILLQCFLLHLLFSFLPLATGKTAIHEQNSNSPTIRVVTFCIPLN